ncbi:MAG: hypothetical protein GX184_09405 [Clostridiaceae bacterium]|nr:hypothetical protein [Clostridiaceae bacterium]
MKRRNTESRNNLAGTERRLSKMYAYYLKTTFTSTFVRRKGNETARFFLRKTSEI